MKRKIIHIDDKKCNGCGLCIPNCMEGALQMIDGKARLVSDLFCDGLGACIGYCPEGAITIEEREAVPYDEMKVMEAIAVQGDNTIIAHLDHLFEHGEAGLLEQALTYLERNNIRMNFSKYEEIIPSRKKQQPESLVEISCGCMGSLHQALEEEKVSPVPQPGIMYSELQQWPVQLHLLNPLAPWFRNSDLILTADCVAFAAGDFHSNYLKGKKIAIACPKLDKDIERYIEKLEVILKTAELRSFSVLRMEVPCCGGLTQIAHMARSKAGVSLPISEVVIGTKGELLDTSTI